MKIISAGRLEELIGEATTAAYAKGFHEGHAKGYSYGFTSGHEHQQLDLATWAVVISAMEAFGFELIIEEPTPIYDGVSEVLEQHEVETPTVADRAKWAGLQAGLAQDSWPSVDR